MQYVFYKDFMFLLLMCFWTSLWAMQVEKVYGLFTKETTREITSPQKNCYWKVTQTKEKPQILSDDGAQIAKDFYTKFEANYCKRLPCNDFGLQWSGFRLKNLGNLEFQGTVVLSYGLLKFKEDKTFLKASEIFLEKIFFVNGALVLVSDFQKIYINPYENELTFVTAILNKEGWEITTNAEKISIKDKH